MMDFQDNYHTIEIKLEQEELTLKAEPEENEPFIIFKSDPTLSTNLIEYHELKVEPSISEGSTTQEFPTFDPLIQAKKITHKSKNKCSQCEKYFNNVTRLNEHMRTHTGEKPFECSVCQRCFTQRGCLTRHVALMHTEEKLYKCEKCPKTFKSTVNLNRHLRVHKGEKPFMCSYCGRSFSRSGNYKLHLSIHEGNKPFKCQHCDQSFTRNSHLNLHTSTIHERKKPFKCQICDKTFGLNCTLKLHMATHESDKPFKCEQCNSVFSCSFNLKKHLSYHTV